MTTPPGTTGITVSWRIRQSDRPFWVPVSASLASHSSQLFRPYLQCNKSCRRSYLCGPCSLSEKRNRPADEIKVCEKALHDRTKTCFIVPNNRRRTSCIITLTLTAGVIGQCTCLRNRRLGVRVARGSLLLPLVIDRTFFVFPVLIFNLKLSGSSFMTNTFSDRSLQ